MQVQQLLSKSQTKYPCVICFQRVKQPATCNQCSKLVCISHINKIGNKCPHCRLSPFCYQKDAFLNELVNLEVKKERELMVQKAMFRCLVEGCDFKGKYHSMDIHRRKNHRKEQLKNIIFQEQRSKKKKQDAVQLLLSRISQRMNELYPTALILYAKSQKQVSIRQIMIMLKHAQSCSHPDCKKVYLEDTMCFVGKDRELSNCEEAQKMMKFY